MVFRSTEERVSGPISFLHWNRCRHVSPPTLLNEWEPVCGWSSRAASQLVGFLFRLVKKEMEYNSLFILIQLSHWSHQILSTHCTLGTMVLAERPYIILTLWNLIPSAKLLATHSENLGLLRDLCLLAAETASWRNSCGSSCLSSNVVVTHSESRAETCLLQRKWI